MNGIEFWHWWVAGLVLIILEFFAPGAFFLWLGLAAGATGFILLAVPTTGWEFQLMWFAILSIACIPLWRSISRKSKQEASDHPNLNRRGEQYIDRVFTLNEPIVNGSGKITVDDSTWKVVGEDCDTGTKVKVVGVDGVVLRVELYTQ